MKTSKSQHDTQAELLGILIPYGRHEGKFSSQEEENARASLVKVKNTICQTRASPKYQSNPCGHMSYLRQLLLVERLLSRGEYVNTCHELANLVHFNPVLQPRMIINLAELLCEYLGVQSLFRQLMNAIELRRQARQPLRTQEEYLKAIGQINQFLSCVTAVEEKRAILDYAIKVVKRDIISEGMAQLLYHQDTPDWRGCIPVPFRFWEDKEVIIDLAKTDTLTIPWNTQRLPFAIRDLLHAPFDKRKSYYSASYYPEIDLAVIENGIHHTAVASMGGGGTISDCTVLHMTPAFEHLTTDGGAWIDTEQGTTSEVEDFRFALLYQLAKMRHDL